MWCGPESGSLQADVQSALLATASPARSRLPSELVAHAVGTDTGHVVGLLEDAERKGIVRIDGHRLRFSPPPAVGRGVYTGAARRARCIGAWREGVGGNLGCTAGAWPWPPPVLYRLTLESLDGAAVMARVRGSACEPRLSYWTWRWSLVVDSPKSAADTVGEPPHGRRDAGRHRPCLRRPVQTPRGGCVASGGVVVARRRAPVRDSFLEAAGSGARAAETGDDLVAAQMLVTLAFALLNAGQLAAAVR